MRAALDRALELDDLTAEERNWALLRLAGRGRSETVASVGTDRREDVLRAATAVFLRRGYHHATLEEVAAEMALTKAGVYHYFDSKQEILDAICERAMTAFEDVIREGLAAPGSAEERLRGVASRYLDVFLGDPTLTVFMRHFADLSDTAGHALRRRRKRVESSLRRAVEEGIREGAFSEGDAHLAVLAMFGSVNWAHSWYEPGGRLSAAEVREALVGQLLTGIRRR